MPCTTKGPVMTGDIGYISGELSGEDLDTLRATGCDVRVVPRAAHLMMDDNLDGFTRLLADPLH